jgi:hypothetical protein
MLVISDRQTKASHDRAENRKKLANPDKIKTVINADRLSLKQDNDQVHCSMQKDGRIDTIGFSASIAVYHAPNGRVNCLDSHKLERNSGSYIIGM